MPTAARKHDDRHDLSDETSFPVLVKSLPAGSEPLAERQPELDEKLAREYDRKLLRETFELSARSLARYWGIDDDERAQEGS